MPPTTRLSAVFADPIALPELLIDAVVSPIHLLDPLPLAASLRTFAHIERGCGDGVPLHAVDLRVGGDRDRALSDADARIRLCSSSECPKKRAIVTTPMRIHELVICASLVRFVRTFSSRRIRKAPWFIPYLMVPNGCSTFSPTFAQNRSSTLPTLSDEPFVSTTPRRRGGEHTNSLRMTMKMSGSRRCAYHRSVS